MTAACSIDWGVVVEFAKVVLNWPALGFVGATCFVIAFRRRVGPLIDRIAKLGPVDFAPQSTVDVDAAPPPPVEALPAATPDGPEALEQARGMAVLYEFLFLNYFLAPATQQTLAWVNTYGPVSKAALFQLDFLQTSPEYEREAIFDALTGHALMTEEPIAITQKGRAYLEWPGRRVMAPMVAKGHPTAVEAPK